MTGPMARSAPGPASNSEPAQLVDPSGLMRELLRVLVSVPGASPGCECRTRLREAW